MGLQNEFRKEGHKKLLIIAPSYPDKDNIFFRGKFVKNQIDSIKIHFDEVIIISPVLASLKVLQKDKICKNYRYDNVTVYYPRCFYIPIFYFNRFFIDNRLMVIENLIKRENIEFDLIHAHFTWPSAYVGVKLKERFKKPVIVTVHEDAEWLYKEIGTNNKFLNHAWKNADALIRINKKDVPLLRQFNKNIYSIPNGFPSDYKILSKKECMCQLNLSLGKKILFSLGGLVAMKGFNHLINSMKMITQKRNDVLCFIGGVGPLRDVLQRQINCLGLKDYVKLLGFIPDDLLPVWMNACDVFVLPSLSEGNPTVMFECMGFGRPFIGTTVGGIPEIIISQDYGLLCEPANSKELSENISISLDKNWDHEKIRKYAKQFTWDVIAKEILDIYDTLLI